MRPRRLLFPSLVVLAVTSLALLACTVDANVGDATASGGEAGVDARVDGSGLDTGSPLEAGPTGDGGTDADAPSPPMDAGCGVGFAQEGAFVDVQVKLGGVGSQTGGTILPGTYVLTAESNYLAGTTGTVQVRETLVVRAASPAGAFERLIEAQKPSGSFMAIPSHGESSTWSTPSGPFLSETPECPKMDFQVNNRFTAQGTTLTIADDQAQIERVYSRIH